MALHTYQLIDGAFVTYDGHTEAAAFRRACEYHPGGAVVRREALHHVCACETKAANATREGGWLICARPHCAGYIG